MEPEIKDNLSDITYVSELIPSHNQIIMRDEGSLATDKKKRIARD